MEHSGLTEFQNCRDNYQHDVDDEMISKSSQFDRYKHSHANKIVKLNVGGKKIDTTEATLTSSGPNFFTSLLGSGLPSIRDERGRYFIDRSGTKFEILLEYLRTGVLSTRDGISTEELVAEADFYGLSLPMMNENNGKVPTEGVFVSSKYGENEIVIFSQADFGYIIRGGSSIVRFSYKTDQDGLIEVFWQTERKPRSSSQPKEKLQISSNSTTLPSSSSTNVTPSSPSRKLGSSKKSSANESLKQSTGMVSSSSSPHLNIANNSSINNNNNSSQANTYGIMTPNNDSSDSASQGNISTTWFLQGNDLVTSSSNTYSFIPHLRTFPSGIYTNPKSGICIHDGIIGGFRLPRCIVPPPIFDTSILGTSANSSMYINHSRVKLGQSEDGHLETVASPAWSPKSYELRDSLNENENGTTPDYIFVDLKNQWVKCQFAATLYCDSIISYQIRCRPSEPVRYRTFGQAEYDWCKEMLTLEIIVLQSHILARLSNYNLLRKDNSLIPMQFSAAFHKYSLKFDKD